MKKDENESARQSRIERWYKIFKMRVSIQSIGFGTRGVGSVPPSQREERRLVVDVWCQESESASI